MSTLRKELAGVSKKLNNNVKCAKYRRSKLKTKNTMEKLLHEMTRNK